MHRDSGLPPLLPIVDADVAARAGWTMGDLAEAYIQGGAQWLQLRAKALPSGPFLDAATAVVARAHQAGVQVIINDRADLALLSHADGVHVGQDDLAPAAVRALVGPSAVVGLSTHTVEQITTALNLLNPLNLFSYLAIGPVFGTATKDTGYAVVGLPTVRAAAERVAGRVPLVAIGGITLARAVEVVASGAASVAVISDLLVDGDPAARVRMYLQHLTV